MSDPKEQQYWESIKGRGVLAFNSAKGDGKTDLEAAEAAAVAGAEAVRRLRPARKKSRKR